MSTTTGQIALFDRALTQPLHDSVVELPAHLLTTVADLMRQRDDVSSKVGSDGDGLAQPGSCAASPWTSEASSLAGLAYRYAT